MSDDMIHITPYNMPSIRDCCCDYLGNTWNGDNSEYQDRIDAMRDAKLLWITDDIKRIAVDALLSETAPDKKLSERAWDEFTNDKTKSVFVLFENGCAPTFNVTQRYSGFAIGGIRHAGPEIEGDGEIQAPVEGFVLAASERHGRRGHDIMPLALAGYRNRQACRTLLGEVRKAPESSAKDAGVRLLLSDSSNPSQILPVTEKGAYYIYNIVNPFAYVNPSLIPEEYKRILGKKQTLVTATSCFNSEIRELCMYLVFLCVYFASVDSLGEIHSPTDEEVRRAPFKSRGTRKRPQESASVKIARLRPQPRNASRIDPETHREYTCRWIVRGHYTNQAYGPMRMLRKRQYIAPYVKGPEGLPLRVKETVFKADTQAQQMKEAA